MGAPVATVKFAQSFSLDSDQVRAFKSAESRNGLIKLTFLVDPKKVQIQGLPSASINAAVGPWASDVEVTHREV